MADDSNDEIFGASEDEQDTTADEEQTMTAAEVLARIEELWVTEMLSPTLECHQTELVDCLIDQMTQMNSNLQKCSKVDFRLAIHKMELERIRYVLSSYLRCRLKKVERFAHHLLEKQSQIGTGDSEILSPEELQFAQKYTKSIDDHFNILAMQHIPEPLREVNTPKMITRPNLDAFVFLKAKKECLGLLLEDNTADEGDDAVDLHVGGQHLLMYRTVESLLKDGDVVLI